MAKRKKEESKKTVPVLKAEFENAGTVIEQRITETIEQNYMPYAMSVIISRAIPEIDGFKPSHRKLLYTMYKMGLLNGAKQKSANIVGQTMKLNPHGDQAIYETMVRLARGNETLLHPYVDSKGNFGKSYSRDMKFAAPRYTEAKLDAISNELFCDIDKDTVDFVDNYDGTVKEPTLFPVTFPSILVNSNLGIAVGMASYICSFNLGEVCQTAVSLLKDPQHDVAQTLKAPDFPGGGMVIYDESELRKIYDTGRGSLRVRCRYNFDKEYNCIEVTEIPPTTTVEATIDKIIENVKLGKIKEISDVRDESDLSGLKLVIDLKRGVDADKLMQKLYKITPLEDTTSCNFNILISGTPMVLGAKAILEEWIAFRRECIHRRTYFSLTKKKDRLHLLKGLKEILLDIDKAIKVIRETPEESMVVPNLMIGFGIDEIQAEYVAEIKLRHLNREYILNKIKEIESLLEEIADLEDVLESKRRINQIMITELEGVANKYALPRKTLILYDVEESKVEAADETPDYPVTLFFTHDGYFKKITPQSLRMSGEQKLKENDSIVSTVEATNKTELLFFTNRCQVYKSKVSEFQDSKASVLGDFVPVALGMDDGEIVRFMVTTNDYSEKLLFFFENGKVAKVEMSQYETKTKRKKLLNAVCDKSPLVAVMAVKEDLEVVLHSNAGRNLILHTGVLSAKTTKNTQGVNVMTLKKNAVVDSVTVLTDNMFDKPNRYRTKNIPSVGATLSQKDVGEQLLID